MTRAMSAVADVTVFLLLVGAAAGAVTSGVGVDQPATTNPAATQASTLATSTASVEYDLVVPASDGRKPPEDATLRRRTSHGTVAELLGEAAMSGVTVDGERLSRTGTDFESKVGATTRDRLHSPGHRTSVRVAWSPYPGAPVKSEYRVGDRPPATVDVRAATVTVPSGMGNISEPVHEAAETAGYDGVATVVARNVVDGLFPPTQSKYALRGDYPSDVLMRARYERMAELTDAGVAVEHQSTAEMNRELTAALAARLRADMRSRYESPEDAARTVRTSRVRVTVRTWSP
ncbi:hypothetical protein Harman_29460 [Haloarcula mannanilytica]|uniref:Uncharacterized protein n=1 Tax=Haloarcula mannanilytica TaxID=2509225 RepID=A0A4C2EKF6_9EURY|nr:hypothetical protein [Haloarcula mannanilytica]GCF15011.1 hypothetical protein Harman_29460 [Haloarcula mannanilytica]